MKKAFTLVELIVVITILAILGTIAFINLQGYAMEARDSKRLSDVYNIQKKIALERVKGTYPSNVMKNGVDVSTGLTVGGTTPTDAKQGIVDFQEIKEEEEKFKDPIGADYVYSYSVGGSGTGAYKFVQLSTVNEEKNEALIVGDYYQIQPADSESIVFADTSNLSLGLVLDGGSVLPYSLNSSPLIISCTTQPNYTNASFVVGTPTIVDEPWQNTNNANPCYYSCTGGYSGNDCNTAPTIGMDISTVTGESVYYAGVYTGGHGLPMAVAGAQSITAWKTSNTSTSLTTVNNSIDGRVNIAAIKVIDSTLLNHPAAKYCDDLVWGGYDDWYLPAGAYGVNANVTNCNAQPGEMQYLYCKHRGTGNQSLLGFVNYSWYRSSYEGGSTFGGYHRFQLNYGDGSDGQSTGHTKTDPAYTRCVRVLN